MARAFAWLVHLYTASGAVLGLLGLMAVDRGDYKLAFALMLGATAVDGTDGVLARLARVRQMAPELDGARLDDIVDYLTYVVLPVMLMVRAGHFPQSWSVPVAAAVLLSSAYGFSRIDAKAKDHFFTGFPSYWNIVAFYLHVGTWAPVVNATIVLLFCCAVFVPIGYVYPTRTTRLRGITLAALVAWGVVLLWMLWQMPHIPRPVVWASLAFPAYYVVLSVMLHAKRSR